MSLSTRLAVTSLLLGSATIASAQATPTTARAKPTKISEDSARAVALREVPSGKIKSKELEKEKGALIYSFDITVPGKTGIEEVHVDAYTGKVLAHEHETPAQERAEAAKEKAAKPKP